MKAQLLTERNISACPFNKRALSKTILKWTSPKTYLIELMYGLDAIGSFNFGKASLNQIARYFEEIFNIDLSNFPRDFYEMRIRNDRTPFLNLINKLINKRMDDPKKPYKKCDTG